MVDDVRRHKVPVAGETPRRAFINDLSLTINDVVYVENVTARTELVAGLATAGYPVSASRPLYVHRGDAGAGRETEVSINGTDFRTLATRGTVSVDGAALVGSYSGQVVSTKYVNQVLSPNPSTGDTIVMVPTEYVGGGILGPRGWFANSTFDIRFVFRISSGNLVVRSLNTSGGPVLTPHAVTGSIDYWRA